MKQFVHRSLSQDVKKMTINIADDIRKRFSIQIPLLLWSDAASVKLEIKPYLQPFERVLAQRELRALLMDGDEVTEQYGYHVVSTQKPESLLRSRLTYWQRVGTSVLEPTVQKVLESTQNFSSGDERKELHNARRLRYGPHDLHEYRGKFFPQLVRSLINISGVPDYSLILDPMCGSGTTPCEAVAAGRSAIGADLNPLSVLIARVKASLVMENAEEFNRTVSEHLGAFQFSKEGLPALVWSENDLEYLARWFDSGALMDIATILREIQKVQKPLYRDFYNVCLSNIIRSVSWQKGEDLRVRKEVTPYENGKALYAFSQEVRYQLDRIYPYLCVLPEPSPQIELCIKHGNAVDVADLFPEHKGRIDLLVTSPPYATALPYLDTDRLSLIVLGILPRKQHRECEAHMVGTREISERERCEAWDKYQKRRHELPRSVTEMIDSLGEHNHKPDVGFRRRNLPALLGKYFLDMLDAMRSAHSLMAQEAMAIMWWEITARP